MTSAARSCACAEIMTPLYFFSSQARRGHAAIPENSANQPFVIGQGPWYMRRASPPIPATKNQAHPPIHAVTIVAVRSGLFILCANAEPQAMIRNPRIIKRIGLARSSADYIKHQVVSDRLGRNIRLRFRLDRSFKKLHHDVDR